jgi:hypothetical protein
VLDFRNAKVDWCVITKAITKTTLVGFEHAYRDYPHFQDSLWLEKRCLHFVFMNAKKYTVPG